MAEKSGLIRMDNIGIVVGSLDNAITFFEEIGLKLEGRGMAEGEWAGRITGLSGQRVEIAMMVTPGGNGRSELSSFLEPKAIEGHRTAPVNALGYLRAMFTVTDMDELVERPLAQGADLVGEIVQYENAYRLCNVRGAEGLLVGLSTATVVKDYFLALFNICFIGWASHSCQRMILSANCRTSRYLEAFLMAIIAEE
nr:VOC family protein [Mucilaginibacter pedocola]